MKRTSEGTFFAGMVAYTYAHGEWEKVRRKLETVSSATADDLRREHRLVPIAQQFNNFTQILANEVLINNIAEKKIPDAKAVNIFKDAADEYTKQPLSDEAAYVALRVVEDYLNEHTVTSRATQQLRRRYETLKKVTTGINKRTRLHPDILHEGMIFLREEMENRLTPEELERANRALA